jgi:transcriptional regulator with XRE-family HTH domain
MTQAELARQAHVTPTYIGRLENGGAAPGIDLVDRLAKALGATAHELLPTTASPDTLAVLREQARRLFDAVLQDADRETLLSLCPLLARLAESPNRGG